MSATRKLNYPDAALVVLGSRDRKAVKYLQLLVHRKAIPHIRVGPRTVLFDEAECLAWIEARRVAEGA